jgi:uncharacterized protein
MKQLPISADSHVTEPPNCYTDYIDPAYRDVAPHIVSDEKFGDIFVINGLDKPIPMGLIAAAGKDPKTLSWGGARIADWHRGGWDSKYRIADQDRDGVAAEVIYPSVGMMLCSHQDFDYKHACFEAYNRWLQEYCAEAPDRLFGMAQIAMRSIKDGIMELEAAKEMGFRGVMMPSEPQHADYDHTDYDPFYETATALDLPLSFHILTSRSTDLTRARGPKIAGYPSVMRANQDVINMFVFGRVFERHPKLKLVCVEADAGWVPYHMQRMDYSYDTHRHWMKFDEMARLPSEYFKENVYLTFQDDWIAIQIREHLNINRLMWANDFPHTDSTWPNSQEMLARHTADMAPAERDAILHGNVTALYGLPQQDAVAA